MQACAHANTHNSSRVEKRTYCWKWLWCKTVQIRTHITAAHVWTDTNTQPRMVQYKHVCV